MIVWVDTETTGLDPERGELLEVALVVTSDDLVEVMSTSLVVQPIAPLGLQAWREHLDPFIQEMHGKNGLLDEIMAGNGVPRDEAESRLIEFVNQAANYTQAHMLLVRQFTSQTAAPILKKTPLTGSTVGFDRAWLKKHMSTLEAMFSYRSIDVSSLTELAARWSPAAYEGRPNAVGAHRALPDVRESIDYLRYYRACGFVGGSR
jgi:oligoribonuclease